MLSLANAAVAQQNASASEVCHFILGPYNKDKLRHWTGGGGVLACDRDGCRQTQRTEGRAFHHVKQIQSCILPQNNSHTFSCQWGEKNGGVWRQSGQMKLIVCRLFSGSQMQWREINSFTQSRMACGAFFCSFFFFFCRAWNIFCDLNKLTLISHLSSRSSSVESCSFRAQRCGSACFTMRQIPAWTSSSAGTLASSCQSCPSSTSWCASLWGCATTCCWWWWTSPTRCPWPCRTCILSTWPSRVSCSTWWRPWSCWAPPSPDGTCGITTTRSTSRCSSSSTSRLWSSCTPPHFSVWTTTSSERCRARTCPACTTPSTCAVSSGGAPCWPASRRCCSTCAITSRRRWWNAPKCRTRRRRTPSWCSSAMLSQLWLYSTPLCSSCASGRSPRRWIRSRPAWTRLYTGCCWPPSACSLSCGPHTTWPFWCTPWLSYPDLSAVHITFRRTILSDAWRSCWRSPAALPRHSCTDRWTKTSPASFSGCSGGCTLETSPALTNTQRCSK